MSGFSFGAPIASQPSASGFSFGSVATTAVPTTTKFSFGSLATTTTTAPTATPSGFTFGNPTATITTTTASTGFGLPTLGTSTTTGAPTGFGLPTFGTSTATTTGTTGGFSFASLGTNVSPATTKTISSGIGATPTTSGVSLGGFGTPTFVPGSTALGTPTSIATPLSFGLNAAKPGTPAFGFPSNSTAQTSTASPFGGLGSKHGFSLGTPAVSTPASTAPSTGFNFNLGTPSAATTTTAKSLAFGLGAPVQSAVTSTVAATTTVASLGGLATKPTTTTSTTTTAAESMASTQPTLTYRQLEDMVNKWTYELDEQGHNFSAELKRLNKSDRVLIANAEKISNLHSKVEACKEGQSRIEQELEFVESQQRALEDLLEPLEAAATDLPPSQQHADSEREAIFQMCINTDLELGQLLSELRVMAERVNSITNDLSSTTEGSNQQHQTVGGTGDDTKAGGNVIGQVTRILNSHMHSLNWLNQNTQELMEKLKFLTAS